MKKYIKCDNCNGTGNSNYYNSKKGLYNFCLCYRCNGRGKILNLEYNSKKIIKNIKEKLKDFKKIILKDKYII